MKSISQKHPRLYFNILHESGSNGYSVKYYDNQYNEDGSLKSKSGFIPSELFINNQSDEKILYDLNKVEFQLLINLINKQKKVTKIYFNKNKLDQFNIINASLELSYKYKKIFLKWFSENEV